MITIKAAFDGDDVKKGMQDLAQEAQKTGDTTVQAGQEAAKATDNQIDQLVELQKELRDVAVAERDARQAREAAAKAAEDEAAAQKKAAAEGAKKAKEERDAAREREQAERDAEQAAQAAATARQVAMLRAGQAAKEFAEATGQFAEAYARTGDLNEAFGSVGEKMTAAMAVINPMAGVITAGAIAAVKLWQNFNGAKESAEKAAEATRKWKDEAKAASNAVVQGIGEASKMASAFTGWREAGDAVATVEKELERIAIQRRLISEQISKVPKQVGMEMIEQKGLLRTEELKLQAQQAILKARHEELAAEHTWQKQNEEATKTVLEFVKTLREENAQTHIEKMEQLVEEKKQQIDDAETIQNKAEEKAKLDKELAEQLQKLNEETAEKLRKNYRDILVDNKERKKLIDQLREGEKKLEDLKQKMHRDEMQRIREKAALEKAEREAKARAEIERIQGQHRAEEEAEKARQERLRNTAPVQKTSGLLQQDINNERKVFEEFVKMRMEAARKQAEAEGKSRRQIEIDVAKARKEASQDWREFQQGRGEFGPVDKKTLDEAREKAAKNQELTQEERTAIERSNARRGMERDIGEARGRIISRNREQAEKDIDRQPHLTPREREIQKEGLEIAERQARESARQGEEIGALAERTKALEKQVGAMEKAGDERRRRNGGRP